MDVSRRPDLPLDRLLAETRHVAAPDLTSRIMGRLGYMRCHAAAASHHRRRRAISRLGLAGLAGLTLAGALLVRQNSELVRRPDALTIPAAIRSDRARLRQLLAPLGGFAVPIRSGASAGTPETEASDAGIEPGEVIGVENLSPFPVV